MGPAKLRRALIVMSCKGNRWKNERSDVLSQCADQKLLGATEGHRRARAQVRHPLVGAAGGTDSSLDCLCPIRFKQRSYETQCKNPA